MNLDYNTPMYIYIDIYTEIYIYIYIYRYCAYISVKVDIVYTVNHSMSQVSEVNQ